MCTVVSHDRGCHGGWSVPVGSEISQVVATSKYFNSQDYSVILLWCRLTAVTVAISAKGAELSYTCHMPVPKPLQRRLPVPLSHQHSPMDVVLVLVRLDLGRDRAQDQVPAQE